MLYLKMMIFYSDRYLGKWGKKNGNEMEWLWR